jgi:Response regulator containing a CheY-like receiver domain and an HTH DNA-binding domain
MREEALRTIRQVLGPDRIRTAEQRGAAMSLAAAAEYALMLTPPGRRSRRHRTRGRSVPGNGSWSPWSPRAGPTPQIAAQLYISVRTVGSHLDRIRDKTGCRRRADLTRLALTAGLV